VVLLCPCGTHPPACPRNQCFSCTGFLKRRRTPHILLFFPGPRLPLPLPLSRKWKLRSSTDLFCALQISCFFICGFFSVLSPSPAESRLVFASPRFLSSNRVFSAAGHQFLEELLSYTPETVAEPLPPDRACPPPFFSYLISIRPWKGLSPLSCWLGSSCKGRTLNCFPLLYVSFFFFWQSCY